MDFGRNSERQVLELGIQGLELSALGFGTAAKKGLGLFFQKMQ